MASIGTATRCVSHGASLFRSQNEQHTVSLAVAVLTAESRSQPEATPAHREPQQTTFDTENLERKQYWFGSVDKEQQEFLETVAKRVHDHGKGLLNTLRSNERSNPKFNFLFETEVRASPIKLTGSPQSTTCSTTSWMTDTPFPQLG